MNKSISIVCIYGNNAFTIDFNLACIIFVKANKWQIYVE